jgi:hypothetical protein
MKNFFTTALFRYAFCILVGFLSGYLIWKLDNTYIHLKQPVEGDLYGVANIWDQDDKRYILACKVTNTTTTPKGDGWVTEKYTYDETSTGVMEVTKNVPLRNQTRVEFVKLENGRWMFQ